MKNRQEIVREVRCVRPVNLVKRNRPAHHDFMIHRHRPTSIDRRASTDEHRPTSIDSRAGTDAHRVLVPPVSKRPVPSSPPMASGVVPGTSELALAHSAGKWVACASGVVPGTWESLLAHSAGNGGRVRKRRRAGNVGIGARTFRGECGSRAQAASCRERGNWRPHIPRGMWVMCASGVLPERGNRHAHIPRGMCDAGNGGTKCGSMPNRRAQSGMSRFRRQERLTGRRGARDRKRRGALGLTPRKHAPSRPQRNPARTESNDTSSTG
jgi:hypothetical protein